jgi:hypothetical protein
LLGWVGLGLVWVWLCELIVSCHHDISSSYSTLDRIMQRLDDEILKILEPCLDIFLLLAGMLFAMHLVSCFWCALALDCPHSSCWQLAAAATRHRVA